MLLTSNTIHTDIIKELFNIFMMQDYWFARAYLVLYIFSPLLNTFVEKTDKKQLSFFLITFYCIQTLHGFITESTWFFYGNSPLSFMGLYLLARYMRLYPSKITRMSKRFDLLAYVGLTLLTTVLSMITVYCKHGGWSFYAYSSPIVILAAVYFFLFFTKISFKSKFINWVALSSFSVYLLNGNSFISQPFYIKTIVSWYISDTSVVFLFHTASLIAIFFVSAIIIDKLRLALWNYCLVLLSKL